MHASSTSKPSRQLTIRDIPGDVLDDLRREAREHGRSVNSVVRAALAEHVERSRLRQQLAAALPVAAALRERIATRHGGPIEDSTLLIREDRAR